MPVWKKKLSKLISVNNLVAVFFLTSTAHSAVPDSLEPEYAKAVITFNGKKYDETLITLDQLLKKAPKTIEFLELKALTLKATQNGEEAEKTYRSLIQIKEEQNSSTPQELAPYYFELGTLEYRKKNYKTAHQHLSQALEGDFNVGATHFFIGMIDFKEGRWESADTHFQGVIASNANDLKLPSHFYRGQTALKAGQSSLATNHFSKAKVMAESTMNNKDLSEDSRAVAQQIHTASSKALLPLQKSQFFGSAGFLSGYDSNVLSLPSSVSSSETTGKNSIKNTLQFGVGYRSSPIGQFQFVPSYRASINYNFNRDTRTGEYFSQLLSLSITRNPLESFHYGIRLGGSLIFQNNLDSESQSSTFKPYLLSASIAPYTNYQINSNWTLRGEFELSPTDFRQDNLQTDDAKRSGTTWSLQSTLINKAGSKYWNPKYSLFLGGDNTQGSEYQSFYYGLKVATTIHLSGSSKLTPSASLTVTDYHNRSPQRDDSNLTLQASFSKKMTRKWTLLGDFSLIRNHSNIVDSYQYSRFVLSGGINYALF